MRRGLTMIELLLALTLLTILCAVMVSWLQTATAATARFAGPARWRGAAAATLQLVHDDLVCGDVGSGGSGEDGSGAKASLVDGVLTIRSRGDGSRVPAGDVLVRYHFDPARGELWRETRAAPGGDSTRKTRRRLLDGVDTWTCTSREDRPILDITITSGDGAFVARSYPW